MLNSKSIGSKIVIARKKLNFTQADLARKVAISPQAVGKWERGESLPDISTLNRLAEILLVDLNFFSEAGQDIEAPKISIETIHTSTEESNTHSRKNLDWNWDMSEGNWTDANFSGLKNLKEKFSSSNINKCNFSNSDLSGLILAKNNIEFCDFSGSDIRNSKIQSSNLLHNQFTKCSFIDAELYKSNIEKCDFSGVDFSGTEVIETNFETNFLADAVWKFTKFLKSNFSNIVFSGSLGNCHFEHCSFYGVKFENATLIHTFFKYNNRFKKVQFINCKVDGLTYAFLKNNQANLSGITLL